MLNILGKSRFILLKVQPTSNNNFLLLIKNWHLPEKVLFISLKIR